MRPSHLSLGLVVALCAGLGGCASILGGGSHETVRVSSNPSGANVRVVDGKGREVHTGTTPFSVSLKRGGGYFAKAKYDFRATVAGRPDQKASTHARLNGWYFGNIVFGGLIGILIVDPVSGAMWDLPDDVLIEFVPEANAAGTRKPPLAPAPVSAQPIARHPAQGAAK
jgi:hypothetical protein